MSDGSPFPPNKSGKHPNSRANLRPLKPVDPPLNPKGHNGRTRSEMVAAFLDAPDDTPMGKVLLKKLGLPDGTPRIKAVLQREYLAALGKSDMARKGLREQYAGKPRISADLTSSDGSLSPMGVDSVVSALRAAIEERHRAPEQPTSEAPVTDEAGAK